MRTLTDYVEEAGIIDDTIKGLACNNGREGPGDVLRQAREFHRRAAEFDDVLSVVAAAHESTSAAAANSNLALIGGGSLARHEFCAWDSDIDLLPLDTATGADASADAVTEYGDHLRESVSARIATLLSNASCSRKWKKNDLSIATLPLDRKGKRRDFYTLEDLFEHRGSDYEPAWASGLRGLAILDGVILRSPGIDCSNLRASVEARAEEFIGLRADLSGGKFPVRFFSFIREQAGSQTLSEFLVRHEEPPDCAIAVARYCTRRLFNGWVNRLLVHLLYLSAFVKVQLKIDPDERWKEDVAKLLENPYSAFSGGLLYKTMVTSNVLVDWVGYAECKEEMRNWIKRRLRKDQRRDLADDIVGQIENALVNFALPSDQNSELLLPRMQRHWLTCERVRRNEVEVVCEDSELEGIEDGFHELMTLLANISRTLSLLQQQSQHSGLRTFLHLLPSVVREGVLQ